MVKGKKSRKGGWKPQKYLEWFDVMNVSELVKSERFNVHLTVMPEFGNDRERKDAIHKTISRIKQRLDRRGKGQKHIGVTVFEKGGEKDRDLHGHHVTRLDKEDCDWLIQYAALHRSMHVTRMRTASDRYKVAGYITKQRRRYSREFEKRNRHRYETGIQPVPGKRISYTKAASELLKEHHKRQTREQVQVIRTKPPGQKLALSGQIEMFPALGVPAEHIRDYYGGPISQVLAIRLEAARHRLDLTEKQLAAKAGFSQPQYANAIAGRFGLSRPATERLKTALAA